MKKPSFLTMFFAALSVAFAVTVAFRLHAYRESTRLSDASSGMGGRPQTPAVSGQGRSDVTTTGAATDPAVAHASGTVATLTQPPTPGSNAAASARQQRFNELLRAAVPESPPVAAAQQTSRSAMKPETAVPPSVKPQSAISRMIAPIVKMLSGGHTAGQASSPSGAHSNPRDPARTREGGAGEKDPTSDTTPPQLLTLQFDPQAINDGEMTTLLVMATDDLSGVRNISGSITSPTGKALQGFALQASEEPNRFTARISVPKDAEEGLWHINFLSLSDNASNTQNLNFSQGTLPPSAQFRVASRRPDSTPPVLKAIWLDKPSIRNGEKVTISVRVEDDKSGVNLVSGVFLSPSKFARIGFGCRQGEDAWQCELTPPKCIDCGTWQLEQIQLQDKANNMATVRTDNPLVGAIKLGVSGDSCDAAPPSMQSFVLDQTSVSNAETATINATAVVSDDQCGVASVSGQAAGPSTNGGQPPRIYFSFRAASDGLWSGQLVVPKLAAKGVWSVVWVQLLDKANNLKTYSQSDPALANAKFVVR